MSPTQAGLIRDILRRADAELVWVTTWAGEVAEYVERVLGWPTHRFAPLPHPDVAGADTGPSGRWWKLDAVEGFLQELQPARFVWSDDDHPAHRSAVAQVMSRIDATGLIQAPRPTVGLSRRWLREAEQHLTGQPPERS